jgi:hypothetical protein
LTEAAEQAANAAAAAKAKKTGVMTRTGLGMGAS